MEEGWKKPPPPNRVNTGSHFAINFFSAGPRRAPTPRHGHRRRRHRHRHRHRRHGKPRRPTRARACMHVHAHGGKVWTRSRKKGSQGAAVHRRDILRPRRPRTGVFVEHGGADGGWAWKWREKERIRRG